MISIYILRKNDSGRIETADRIINSKFVPMLETELSFTFENMQQTGLEYYIMPTTYYVRI